MSHVLIIGGGVSGLSAGIFALRNGHKVTICEKYAIPGGHLTSWQRKGYTIDTCIHWLTGTNPNCPIYSMWQTLGVLGDGVEILRPEILFTVEHDGKQLSLNRSLDKTINDMLVISPSDKNNILTFKKAVEAMASFLNTYGPDKNRTLKRREYIPYLPALLKYYLHSTGEIADTFTHPLLKLFFNSLLGCDMNAIDFAFVAATFVSDNADLPKGMSKPMAMRMTERFKSLGGSLLLNKEAVKINLSSGRADSVTFKDGDTLPADYVVLCTDPYAIFGKVLDYPLPKPLKKQFENKNYKYFSSYHIEYTVDMPKVPFTENLFIEVPDELKEKVGNRRITVRDFTSEPGFSTEGTRNIQTMVYCEEEEIRKWITLYDTDKEAYKACKKVKEEAVTGTLIKRFPEFEGKLHVLDSWTPATFKRYTGSHMGTYQSFINPKRKAPTRVDACVPGLNNVFLGSQWQMCPGGLPTAASCGLGAIKAMDGFIK